jgi:hypothetical protein
MPAKLPTAAMRHSPYFDSASGKPRGGSARLETDESKIVLPGTHSVEPPSAKEGRVGLSNQAADGKRAISEHQQGLGSDCSDQRFSRRQDLHVHRSGIGRKTGRARNEPVSQDNLVRMLRTARPR